MENYFEKLSSINVNEHVERKGEFSYLSWPFAVQQLRLADPSATWEVRRFDGFPYLKTETGYFVEVAVTVQSITLSQIHPVLDDEHRPIAAPTCFEINTSIQRALVKAIALHGLGLCVYAGEDLRGKTVPLRPAPVSQLPAPSPASSSQLRYIKRLIEETGSELTKVLEYFGVHALEELSSRGEPCDQVSPAQPEGRVMAKIVRLIQGSPEWHEHRQQHRNASETPAVLGVSPWLTPYQLWLLRSGRAEPKVNPAMLRGSQLEPLARESYERVTGLVMQPLVLVDGDYSASLDGMTLDGGLVLEIKCPVKGKESDLWQQVESGQLPEHYRLQVEHQLMVSGAELAHVYVFDGADGVLLEHRPEPACWAKIRAGWDAFMQLVETDVAPPLTERDVVLRTDNAWRAAAESYRWAKWRADRAAVALNDARQQLIALASHPSERGCGVVVTRYWKAGTVDYKQLPQLADVDLEQYRGAAREELRVTIVD